MLSFFKFPFNSRKQQLSESNLDNVLLDILRKRLLRHPDLPLEKANKLVEKFQKKFKRKTGASTTPEKQYEALKKTLQDLDHELD